MVRALRGGRRCAYRAEAVRVEQVLVPRVLGDGEARAVGQQRLAVAEARVGRVIDRVGRAHVEQLATRSRLAERREVRARARRQRAAVAVALLLRLAEVRVPREGDGAA